MVFNYKILNEGIGFLVGFGWAMQYFSMCQKIWYGTQCTYEIPREGSWRCIK
jgi:hypothetical protein